MIMVERKKRKSRKKVLLPSTGAHPSDYLIVKKSVSMVSPIRFFDWTRQAKVRMRKKLSLDDLKNLPM